MVVATAAKIGRRHRIPIANLNACHLDSYFCVEKQKNFGPGHFFQSPFYGTKFWTQSVERATGRAIWKIRWVDHPTKTFLLWTFGYWLTPDQRQTRKISKYQICTVRLPDWIFCWFRFNFQFFRLDFHSIPSKKVITKTIQIQKFYSSVFIISCKSKKRDTLKSLLLGVTITQVFVCSEFNFAVLEHQNSQCRRSVTHLNTFSTIIRKIAIIR